MGAILASGDRRVLLRSVVAPTLVIHGAADPLVPVAAGRDTARHVAGTQFEIIGGMGHDFPPALMTRVAARIADHCRKQGRCALFPEEPRGRLGVEPRQARSQQVGDEHTQVFRRG